LRSQEGRAVVQGQPEVVRTLIPMMRQLGLVV